MEGIRCRVVFRDEEILSESQKSEGLKRSWLLVKPQLKTISDLSSHLLNVFQLHQSCPHGLILSIKGFVLPHFESICILEDKNLLSVRKKGVSVSIKRNDTDNATKELEIVGKQPLNTGVLLLADEEFEKESGGYQSEDSGDKSEEEDEVDPSEISLQLENLCSAAATSKKRKASEKLHDSKKKRQRSEVIGTENDVQPNDIGNLNHAGNPVKMNTVLNIANKICVENNIPSAKVHDNVKTTADMKKNGQLQQNEREVEDIKNTPEVTRKPSRSARRKKSKRQWLKEMAKIQKTDEVSRLKAIQNWKNAKTGIDGKKETSKRAQTKSEVKEVAGQQKGLLHLKQFPGKHSTKSVNNHGFSSHSVNTHIVANQNHHVEDELVRIQIRPGHIRFEPLEKEDAEEGGQKSETPMGTVQWNGITSKRKGQKWGLEKLSSSQEADYRNLNKEDSSNSSVGKDVQINEHIDFDKLPSLTSIPKQGDVIAYRLVELGLSWTPELSSFRVGKVQWYSSESSRVMLVPVAQYPIPSRMTKEDESENQPDDSLYKEDGSLEIDYAVLVDVRIIRDGNSDAAKGVTDEANKVSLDEGLTVLSDGSDKQTDTRDGELNLDMQKVSPATENGVSDLWERFSETLNAKKAQLSQENSWGKGSSGKSSWSYKALRGSALGPTMALLRSKSEL